MKSTSLFVSSLAVLSILLASCGSSSSEGYNPAEGMQVATLSGTPGGNSRLPTATTVPSGVSGSIVLLQDDFSNSSSGWEVYSGDYGYAGYEQGGYVVEAIVEKEYSWGVAGVNFDNVRIDVDATVLLAPGDLSDGFGVDCRIQENGDGYGFRISSDGYAEIMLYSNEENIELYDWTSSAAIQQDGKANHLTAICEGNHFSLYVNDVFIAEVVDDTFASGDIALSAISFSTDPVKVLFDDIIVYSN